jgi:transcriptional regulator with XRE-family HTH domain
MDSLKQKQNSLVLYRKRKGYTQRQVARLLGHRNATMVSHYEHGRALPPLSVALGLEIIYRVPVAFLFSGMYDELRRQIRKQEETIAGTAQHILF